MGYEFGVVRNSDSAFGKILEDQGKTFDVLWSSGEVSPSDLQLSKKVVLNSPSFFALVRPDRNQAVFNQSPAQLAIEVLWEANSLLQENAKKLNKDPGQPVKLSSSALKEKLQTAGLSAAEVEAGWKQLRREAALAGSQLALDPKGFWLQTSDVEVKDAILVDWGALSSAAQKQAVSQAASEASEQTLGASATTGDAQIPESKLNVTRATIDNTWAEVAELMATLAAQVDAGELSLIEALEALFASASLAESNQKEFRSAWGSSSSPRVQFLGSFLIGSPIKASKELSATALGDFANAISLFASKDDAPNKTQELALVRALGCVDVSALFKVLPDKNFVSSLSFILSLLEQVDKPLAATAAEEFSRRIRAGLAVENEEIEKLQTFAPWGSPWKPRIVEALMECLSPVLNRREFWNGISLAEVASLARSSKAWPRATSRPLVREPLGNAVSRALTETTPQEALSAMAVLPAIGSLLEQKEIDRFVSFALESTMLTRRSLEVLKNSSEFKESEKELSSLKEQLTWSSDQLTLATAKVAALTAELEQVNQRLNTAERHIVATRESERKQFEINSAKEVAQFLVALDTELGPLYEGRNSLLAQARRLGIEEIASQGVEVSFSSQECEDPENKALEGDTVLIVSPGFRWSSSGQVVVLSKALVAKTN